MSLQTTLLGRVPAAFRSSQYEPFGHSYSAMLVAYISPLRIYNVRQLARGLGGQNDGQRRTCNPPSGRREHYIFLAHSSCTG
jgi:hypothetical protein